MAWSPTSSCPRPISLDEVGESSLEAALPWDRIAAAPFRRFAQPAAVPTPWRCIATTKAAQQVRSDLPVAGRDIDVVRNAAAAEDAVAQPRRSARPERDPLDAERLERENKNRSAQGKPAVQGTRRARSRQQRGGVQAEKAPDILLDQTAQILADIVRRCRVPAPAVVQERQRASTGSPVRANARSAAAAETPEVIAQHVDAARSRRRRRGGAASVLERLGGGHACLRRSV